MNAHVRCRLKPARTLAFAEQSYDGVAIVWNTSAGLNSFEASCSQEARRARREAITSLPFPARRELRALTWLGRGGYAAKDLERTLADALASDDDITTGALLDQADSHNLLMNVLYGLELV